MGRPMRRQTGSDLLARASRFFALACLLMVLLVIPILTARTVALPLRLVAGSSLIWLSWWWLRVYRQRKSLEDELRIHSFYDPLTHLPNRAQFLDRLSQTVTKMRRHSGEVGVLFLDLDNFKVINDSLGHGTGDRLLVGTGRRISGCVRGSGLVARFGGDEFAVLLESVHTGGEVVQLAERIVAELRRPYRVKGRDLFITASVGVVVSPRSDEVAWTENLLREVDIALNEAKTAGKNRTVVFDPEMNAGMLDRLDLVTDLRQAVQRDELRLVYQPLIDLRTDTIVGMEALVRWQHPKRGLVSPDAFIALAEECGLILSIGHWVLEEACRQTHVWQAQHVGGRPIEVSVNLSVHQFRQPDIVDEVAEVLRSTGLPAACLKPEIPESVVMQDVEATLETLRALKALGVKLAIDDFGTGYSSLSYLQRFPLDTLKVDQSFVRRLGQDTGSTAIVEAIIALAHALGLKTTVEGIETSAQLETICHLQGDWGQGFLFSRPVPAGQMIEFLNGTE
ncbi:MAG: putative bifunctional diguanylate cyclase/phosphodiesterase, partial [Dehalococcoidia bacterium]